MEMREDIATAIAAIRTAANGSFFGLQSGEETVGHFLRGRSLNFSSCNGQIVGQPRKRECRQNVRKMSKKMSEKCPKNCPEGLNTQFSDIFWTIFAYLVDAFVW